MDRDIKSPDVKATNKVINIFLFFTLSLGMHAQSHTVKEEVIRVGLLSENYPPLFWRDEDKGIVKEVLKAVSENSRFTFEYSYYPFNRLISKVINNELDVEAWTSPAWRTPYKQQTYFTNAIAEHCEITIFRKNESFKTPSPDSIVGKRLGVVQNFTFPSFEPFFANKSIYRADGSNEQGVLKMLAYKRTDLALMDRTVADYLLNNQFPDQFETGSVFDCVPVSFMFNINKNQQGKEIDKVLQRLKRDGVIESILKKYE